MDVFCIGLCKGLFGTLHLTGIFRHLLVITFFGGKHGKPLFYVRLKNPRRLATKKGCEASTAGVAGVDRSHCTTFSPFLSFLGCGIFTAERARGYRQSRHRWNRWWRVFQLRLTGQQRHERFVPVIMASQPTPPNVPPPAIRPY